MSKILFIGAHRLNRSPSQRFRFEQYFSFLEENGFRCHLSPLLDETQDKFFYQEGNLLRKGLIVAESFRKRIKDVKRTNQYDLVFIQREAFMTGTTYFEKQFKKTGKKIIFDFDDAVWLPNVSEGNSKYVWLKNPSKTSAIISLSDLVITGNNYLSDYAKNFNQNVFVIPTTIDTEYHKRKNAAVRNRICIGWTGSHTTIPHFEHSIPALKKLKEKYGDKIYFKVIGDEYFSNRDLNIQGIKWTLQDEIEQLSEIDIGIMPLPDNEWTKGKCGFKGLQYMSLEIPCVMSPVGVNTEIIAEGINGFLAKDENDWVEKISLLIENAELRKKIGAEARKTVEERYSVNSQKEKYLSLFNNLLK